MLHSVLYVSRCRIDPSERDEAVERLVVEAAAGNLARDITGALVCSGGWFAQVLEGTRDELESLFARIAVDPRHGEVILLEDVPIPARRFGDWGLAYIGPSQFVQRTIAMPLAQARRGSKPAVQKLLALMEGLARQD